MEAHPRTRESADAQPVAALPSLPNLKKILRLAVDQGRLTWSATFQRKCMIFDKGIGFNTIDAANVVRNGRIVKKPKYDGERVAWRCELADSVEGCKFVVEIALDCEQDFAVSPRVTVINGFWRRGRRREVKDWSML